LTLGGTIRERVARLNSCPVRAGADYVLYWCQVNRRADANPALLYAANLANELGLPLLCYEGLTCSYPHANDRLHTFILEGVPDTQARLDAWGVGYVFHLRRRRTDPDNALHLLVRRAAALVTDDHPTFLARRHNATLPGKLDLPYHVVDGSCVVPMRCMEKHEYGAYTIRPKIHRLLSAYLVPQPEVTLSRRWSAPPSPLHTPVRPGDIPGLVASCDIDHSVPPSTAFRGGASHGKERLKRFLAHGLSRYETEGREPSARATSNLSPYLHFGHVSAVEVARQAQQRGGTGSSAAAFLEQLVVRRELAFNHAHFSSDPASLDNLPDWARRTLDKHAGDPRQPGYTPQQLESAATHDDVWNASQRELLTRGVIHNYVRMYWGKKILEWSATVEDARRVMVDLHDRYALDGRDPNTYASILWCLGLHDRPWGERPVLGTVRYMSHDGMKRKIDVPAYVREMSDLARTGKDPRG
jgi:deoxyribodipyrimidine photo-lyase